MKSIMETQKFEIEQDLSFSPNSISQELNTNKENSIPQINVEVARVNAANEIRIINQQLKLLEDIEKGSNDIYYLAYNFPGFLDSLDSNLVIKLNKLDSVIAEAQLSYKKSDKYIQNLLKNRDSLINLIYNQAKGYLNGKKDDAKARLAASKRPEGVLFKYKQLLANKNKNISTLDNLSKPI